MEGKYSIELFRDGGEGAGIEKILVRHDSLTVARVLYKAVTLNYSERLIMLCDKAAGIGAQRPAGDYRRPLIVVWPTNLAFKIAL